MSIQDREQEQGFTLIEAMIAMVIASVVLLAMGLFTLSVLRSDNLAKEQTVATHIAEQQLEQWYSNCPSGVTCSSPPSPSTTVPVNGTTYQLQSFDAIPVSGVKSSTLSGGTGTQGDIRAITVYWKNATGVHKVTVTDMEQM